MPNEIVVELPFDWVGSVLIPTAAVLISGALAVAIATLERRAAARARAREQAAQLIRALSELGRAAAWGATDEYNEASARYEQELNALAALLSGREIAIPKFVCEVIERIDPDDRGGMVLRRGALWAGTALELWCRGKLSARDFEHNMPKPSISWIEVIDLGQWQAAVRGEPAIGIEDLDGYCSSRGGVPRLTLSLR